jgi:multidrug efflux pump subunit AcrB
MLTRNSAWALTALAGILTVGGTVSAGPERGASPPAILVEAEYRGAGARIVADTVAAVLEAQVRGVAKALHVASRSTDDGRCVLTVTFEPGTDLRRAQELVQKRVQRAMPVLPAAVKRNGVTVRQKPPGVLLILNVFSPDRSRDTLDLSNYARNDIVDQLNRVAGVGRVVVIRQSHYSMRIWLDPDKLAAAKLKAADVVRAIREQNAQVAAGQIGQPPVPRGQVFQYTVTTLGRLTTPEQFGDIIVKTGLNGRVVRLKDVAEVVPGARSANPMASLNGRPGVVLCVYPLPGTRPSEVRAEVRRAVAGLRKRLPKGVALEIPFDFAPNWRAKAGAAPPGYLLLDVALPDAASAEQVREVLERCDSLLHAVRGVKDVLALGGNPFDMAPNRPCLLIRLAPAAGREGIAPAVRTRLRQKLPEAAVWLRDLARPGAFPRCGYPVHLAVSGPKAGRVRALADGLAARLGRSPKLTDVRADRASTPRPQLYLEIDREKARKLGVALTDVMVTLQAYLGSFYVNDFNNFGRTWQVVVQAGGDARPGGLAGKLKRLQVRNARGEMVPLSAVMTVRDIQAPQALGRLDGLPMVELTANLARGVSPAEARALCEALAGEVSRGLRLSAEYRLTWLADAPAAK